MSELYDPTVASTEDDPFAVYRELRDRHRVYRNETLGFWALSRFDDVWSATRDFETFSNDPTHLATDRPPSPLLPEGTLEFGLFFLDPPVHNRLRSLVSLAFTPRRVSDLDSAIRRTCRRLLQELVSGSEVDFVSAFAAPLPMAVIGDLLGVPPDEREQFRSLWRTVVERPASVPAEDLERNIRQAMGAIFDILRRLVETRRHLPGDDLITALIEAELDGDRLDEEQIVSICYQLNVAGNDTTSHLLSHATLLLLDRPELLHRICADPAIVPDVVEEILRFESPSPFGPRVATRDVVVGEDVIPAGSMVALLYGAANRDEREFTDPDRLDIGRRAPRHLAFGHGTHFCLGAHLARIEARVAIEELAPVLLGLQVADRPERLQSPFIRGIVRLPLERVAS
jgi:cytochrome P450 family 130